MTIDIFYRESPGKDGSKGYRWAWKESLDMNMFGWASSIEEIERRAKRMFPGRSPNLIAL